MQERDDLKERHVRWMIENSPATLVRIDGGYALQFKLPDGRYCTTEPPASLDEIYRALDICEPDDYSHLVDWEPRTVVAFSKGRE